MRQPEERYISLLTDFGFKRIFGTTPNKDLLINFLNSLFNGEQVIRDVHFLNSEHVGDVYADRKAIFDVYCENEHGEKFIVEMQNAFQQFFKDRSLFYSTFPIREQAPKGADWDFRLNHVYVVALLNFNMHDEAFDPGEINHDVGLLDKKTCRVFNDKLTFKYVEVAKFSKTVDELETLYDKWLFVLKHLAGLSHRPKALAEKIFTRLFSEAEFARLTKEELHEYEDSLKAYRDIKNSIDTAHEEGRAEGFEAGRAEGLEAGRAEGLEAGRAEGLEAGRAEGARETRLETARNMLAMGLDASIISKALDMSREDIKAIGPHTRDAEQE